MSTATEIKGPEVKKAVGVERPRQMPRPAQVQVERLFSDVLLETSDLQRHRRTVSAVLSFVVQCLLLGVLLIVPLMFTDVLPQQQLLTFLMAPPPPPPPPPAASVAAAKVVKVVESDILNGRLRAPSKIPQNVQMIREDEAPPDLSGGGVPGGVPGGIPGGQLGGVIGGILSSTPNAAAVPKLVAPVPTKRIRVSQGVTEGRLIQKIEPTYPPLARSARIQGQVVLAAIISKSGEIQNLVLVSGHPLLVPATLEAVKKWRYRPYLLNGEPVEVETTITVNFELSY
ncbi:MAG: energy transducer TonB [Terriglobales bacterium]|jgi:periplasmic protein TonB